ncbi:hypothetical protein Thiofri_04838 [Thiorhodovibrio frisius]|nr:hypothetical protein Thiofri_04838 [Thiorhodovibrio frisius]
MHFMKTFPYFQYVKNLDYFFFRRCRNQYSSLLGLLSLQVLTHPLNPRRSQNLCPRQLRELIAAFVYFLWRRLHTGPRKIKRQFLETGHAAMCFVMVSHFHGKARIISGKQFSESIRLC